MPSVSVVIPTYNRLDMLRRAVRTVLEQTFADFELIIIDDGSTDETFERFVKKRPPVRYFYQPHQGVSAARNRGVALARGDFIAFLDSDDLWEPRKLEIQTEYMQSHPEVLICQTEETWIRNGVRVNPKKRHEKPSGDIFERSLELCLVSPSAVMMRREFFDAVGMFDERMPVCEDYDLWLRTAVRMPVLLIDEPLTIKHGGHGDQLSHAYPAMDRYRVYALQKLLRDELSGEQRKAVLREIRRKCGIIRAGALKRRRLMLAAKAHLTGMFPAANWGIV